AERAAFADQVRVVLDEGAAVGLVDGDDRLLERGGRRLVRGSDLAERVAAGDRDAATAGVRGRSDWRGGHRPRGHGRGWRGWRDAAGSGRGGRSLTGPR